MFCAFSKCCLKQLHAVLCVVKFKHNYSVTTKKKEDGVPEEKLIAQRLLYHSSGNVMEISCSFEVSASPMLLMKLLWRNRNKHKYECLNMQEEYRDIKSMSKA